MCMFLLCLLIECNLETRVNEFYRKVYFIESKSYFCYMFYIDVLNNTLTCTYRMRGVG